MIKAYQVLDNETIDSEYFYSFNAIGVAYDLSVHELRDLIVELEIPFNGGMLGIEVD